MKTTYYARVDLDAKKYIALIKIEDYDAFYFSSGEWVKNNEYLGVRFDTTHYDQITEDVANQLVTSWGGKGK